MRIIDICNDCQATRESPAHRLFNPACLHCGARLIQRLGKLPRPKEEIASRRRQVLTDWMAYGHAEGQLRALAKLTTPALAPIADTRSTRKPSDRLAAQTAKGRG
jgi:hypothetical protein